MAVIRVEKTQDYTVMSNTHFREKEMSLKAKGLLSLMLSLPDEWDYSVAGLATLCKDEKASISGALKELEKFGYVTRKQAFNEKGKFAGYDYIVSEIPFAENTSTENTSTCFTSTENPPQLNTKQLNTKKSNTKECKKESKTSYDAILSKIQDDSLKELYLEYIKMRKMIKSPMTDKALQMLINKVERLEPTSIDRQKLLLETAILNNWKSVYPLKDETSQPTARRETVPSWLKNKETSLDRDELENLGLEGYIKPQTSAEELKQRLKEKYGKGDKH